MTQMPNMSCQDVRDWIETVSNIRTILVAEFYSLEEAQTAIVQANENLAQLETSLKEKEEELCEE